MSVKRKLSGLTYIFELDRDYVADGIYYIKAKCANTYFQWIFPSDSFVEIEVPKTRSSIGQKVIDTKLNKIATVELILHKNNMDLYKLKEFENIPILDGSHFKSEDYLIEDTEANRLLYANN